jgi:hypothetical protein
LAIDGSVRDGIVGFNAVTSVNVEGTNSGVDGDFQQVGRVGGIPSSNHKDKVQSQV